MSDQKRVKVRKEFSIPLDEAGVALQARVAAGLQAEVDAKNKELLLATEEFNEVKRSANETIKQKEESISELLREVTTGMAKKIDDVDVVYDFSEGIARDLWPAGAENQIEVGSRVLEGEERQMSLSLVQGGDAEAIQQSVPDTGQELKE
jgi:hypothetical protein